MKRSPAMFLLVCVLVSLLVSPLGSSICAGAQSPPKVRACPLHVRITDEDGGSIRAAFVLIHADSGTKINQQLVLDQTGQGRMNLHPQLYELFVSSVGFAPVAQILDLRSCKPLDINLMLTIDPEQAAPDKN